MISGSAVSQLDKQSIQQITPAFVTSPPSIDGRLDDACWASAPIATDFRRNDGKGPAACQTIGRVCYDAENIYIAMECIEPEIGKLTAVFTKDGDPVWRDDSVEIFIAPYAVASREDFYHFSVNCLGARNGLIAESSNIEAPWTAAASTGTDRWFAEMAIPFKLLQPVGLNEPYWRIQFCRTDLVHAEESSWSEVPTQFSSFWRFGRLMQPASGLKFINYRGKPQPIRPSGTAKGAQPIKQVPSEHAEKPVIIPEPREVKQLGGSFTITPETRILIGKSSDPMDRRPAEEINEEIQRVAGFTLPIIDSASEMKNCIILGERQAAGVGKEGYVLEVKADSIAITGVDQAGAFWGAETLRQLISREATNKVTVPRVIVRDWPKFEYRGVHLLATSDALSFHGRMIEKVFSRFKINNILLQCEHVEWDSHPEIRNQSVAMSKADVRKLIEIARLHHITVTPLLQSLGHLEWAFYGGNNLDMAEDPTTPYAYCPLNPKSHKFMADLIDETIELFGHPEYISLGRDEFDMRGQFPVHEECRRIGKEQLYIDDTIWLHDYLKARGTKMMMWGDMLSKPGFQEKVDQLPKDIVICDWHYGPNTEYPTLDFFKQHGFKVIGCTWYNPKNLCYFSADAYKRGIVGMMQTTWTGFWPEQTVLRDEFHQIHSYILGAAWAWSPGSPTLDDLPYESDRVFSDLWFTGESKVNRRWFSVDLSPYCNMSLKAWLNQGEGNDLSGLPKGVSNLGGIPFNLGNKQSAILLGGLPGILDGFGDKVTGIPVGSKADRLYFLSTTAFGEREGRKAGEYIIHYEDGTSERVDLVYGQTISAWDASRPASRTRSAWRGKTLSGSIIRVNTFVWDNPSPDKVIKSLDFLAADGQAAPTLIAITGETRGE
jgi:hexosaminidase